MLSDVELLAIQFQTTFVFERVGRILTLNDPDRSPAPSFTLFGCPSGNTCGVRADIEDSIAAQLVNLAASEPPFVKQSGAPSHLDRYIALLSGAAPAPRHLEVTYVVPNDIPYEHDVQLVYSDSPEGQELRAALATEGIPSGLAKMGFTNVSELWDPWCAALHDAEVASVAFAARLSETGACLGLATSPELRGRGYAAAATAGWARMPALRPHALFYSTSQTNISSQRVIARLGLRFLGGSRGI